MDMDKFFWILPNGEKIIVRSSHLDDAAKYLSHQPNPPREIISDILAHSHALDYDAGYKLIIENFDWIRVSGLIGFMMKNLDSSHLMRVQNFIEADDMIRRFTGKDIYVEDLSFNSTEIQWSSLEENDFNLYKAFLDTKRTNRFLTAKALSPKDYYRLKTMFFKDF